jgi:hypothetical protein
VENAELDVALEELENRLERLRALYEQYFMGLERIEPQIPRKDIDRRIYVLRREKIRNTAKRFKLQTIISRYNTFQQYWQRICREIETGTYKRHLIRAERIAPGQLLTIAARKRLGRHAFDDVSAEPAPPNTAASSAPPPPSVPATASGADPAPAAAAAPALPPLKPGPPPKPGARPAKPAATPPAATPATAMAAGGMPAAAAKTPAAATPAAERVAARAFESLDLDMDFMGDWDPTAAAEKGPRTPAAAPSRPFGAALAQPLGAASSGAPTRSPTAATAAGTSGAAPKPAGAAARPAAAPIAGAGSAPGVPAAPKPVALASAPKPPIQSASAATPKPVSPPSAAVPPAATQAAAARPAAVPVAQLSDDRVRELHARLVEAKRQTKDAGAVTVEGLAKSLKATEAKLREQHKNRKIDFDVVIKDGRAVLKPIVR